MVDSVGQAHQIPVFPDDESIRSQASLSARSSLFQIQPINAPAIIEGPDPDIRLVGAVLILDGIGGAVIEPDNIQPNNNQDNDNAENGAINAAQVSIGDSELSIGPAEEHDAESAQMLISDASSAESSAEGDNSMAIVSADDSSSRSLNA